jgi:hypothetical protein
MTNTPAEPQTNDDWLILHDPHVSDAQILATLRERVASRRAALGVDNRRFPQFGMTPLPDEPIDAADPELYQQLRLLNEIFADAPTEPVLASSPATNLPVIGKLWATIRAQAHALVLFYVNRHLAHTIDVNRNLVSAMNLLVRLSDEQAREIAALKAGQR